MAYFFLAIRNVVALLVWLIHTYSEPHLNICIFIVLYFFNYLTMLHFVHIFLVGDFFQSQLVVNNPTALLQPDACFIFCNAWQIIFLYIVCIYFFCILQTLDLDMILYISIGPLFGLGNILYYSLQCQWPLDQITIVSVI